MSGKMMKLVGAHYGTTIRAVSGRVRKPLRWRMAPNSSRL